MISSARSAALERWLWGGKDRRHPASGAGRYRYWATRGGVPPSSLCGGGGPSSIPHHRPLSIVLPSKIDDEDDDDDVVSTFVADDGTGEAAQNGMTNVMPPR